MYDPVTLNRPQQTFTNAGNSLIKGTGGILVHPSLRASTSASTTTRLNCNKMSHGRNMSFIGSESFSTRRDKAAGVAPFHGSERMSRDENTVNSAGGEQNVTYRQCESCKNSIPQRA